MFGGCHCQIESRKKNEITKMYNSVHTTVEKNCVTQYSKFLNYVKQIFQAIIKDFMKKINIIKLSTL